MRFLLFSNILIVVDRRYPPLKLLDAQFIMTPSKTGKTKNLTFYSLLLAQIVEPLNSIKRRTYDCGAIILGHIVESFNCT